MHYILYCDSTARELIYKHHDKIKLKYERQTPCNDLLSLSEIWLYRSQISYQGQLDYLTSYPEKKIYCVQISKSSSAHKIRQREVPYGSALGPISLSVYTIGLLPRKSGVDFKEYADETQFYL